MKRNVFLTVAGLVATSCLAGCGSSNGNGGDFCVGTNCICPQGKTCNIDVQGVHDINCFNDTTCDVNCGGAGGCDIGCMQGSTCSVDCTLGCDISCQGKTCDVSCSGSGCDVDCSMGTGACNVTCTGGACDVTCGAAEGQPCLVDCPGGSCNVYCGSPNIPADDCGDNQFVCNRGCPS